MNLPGNQLQTLALFGAGAMTLAAIVLLVVVVLTGHDLNNQSVLTLLGFAFTIIVALLGFAGLGGAVQNVHLAVNSRLDQMINTTAADAFQQGQAAGPAASPSGATAPTLAGSSPTSTSPADPAVK